MTIVWSCMVIKGKKISYLKANRCPLLFENYSTASVQFSSPGLPVHLSLCVNTLLLPRGSLHILEAIEKFWFDGWTVRPSVRIKKQPIRNAVIWRSLANQQLSYKKNWHVVAQRKIVLAQRKSHVLAASYINQNTVDQSQGFAVYSNQSQGLAVYMWQGH